jgi:hypothetical protein
MVRQGDVDEGADTETTITFVARDMLTASPAGLFASIGDIIRIRHVSGDEVLCLSWFGPNGQGGQFARDNRNPSRSVVDCINSIASECIASIGCIVVALATRNTLKTTSINTRIGTSKRIKAKFEGPLGVVFLSTTTLDVPPANQLAADPEHPAREGVWPRPHLRCGHPHQYAVGPGRTERIRKWLAPCFVNADPDFVAKAREYVLK